jgi:uncharacterized protein
MHVLIAGGTGFIGTALVTSLVAGGHNVSILTRSRSGSIHPSGGAVRFLSLDGKEIGLDPRGIENVDAIVNLAGVSIGSGRWTAARKEAILASRRDTTRALREFSARLAHRPSVLVNSSGVGYYGSVPDGEVREDHPPGGDFLAHVCKVWEDEAQAFSELGMRVVRLRFGVVLGSGGGALQRMILPFRFGIGGPIGSGRQWFPWIHLDDAVGLIHFALSRGELSGAVNASAPQSVTSRDFARALGAVMHRPAMVRVPAAILKIALGEMAEMLLTGQNAVPARAVALGYRFRYPTLAGALNDIVR